MTNPGTTTNKDRNKKFSWFRWLRLAGIILFVVILFQMDLSAIWKEMGKADAGFIMLALLFQLLLLFAKAIRWHLLNAANRSQRIVQSFGEFFESYAMGVITPGRFGELMKAGYQNKRQNMIASGIRVIAERGVDIGFFVFVAGLALYLGQMIPMDPVLEMGIIIGGLLIFLIGVMLFSSKKINSLFDRFIRNFSETFVSRKFSNVLYIILLSVLSNVFYFVSCFIVAAYALQLPISFLMLSGGVAVAGLLNLLPITVMGLGTREVTFLYIFNQFPDSQILALSVLIFAVAQVGGGLISLLAGQIYLQVSKRNKSVDSLHVNDKDG